MCSGLSISGEFAVLLTSVLYSKSDAKRNRWNFNLTRLTQLVGDIRRFRQIVSNFVKFYIYATDKSQKFVFLMVHRSLMSMLTGGF